VELTTPKRVCQGAAGLVLVAVLLTLAMAAPVLRAPGSRLFGWEIVGRHPDPFIVINQFEHPRPVGLFTQPATDYAGAAIAGVTGDGVLAYNIVVLATFPLAALFAYLLAFHLTGSRQASWLAGLLYAFAPFHIAQSAYHPHGAQIQWLPLYLLALWLCLEKAGFQRLLLLALSLALVVLSNFYYGFMAAALTPFAVLGFWLVQRGRARGRPGGLLRTVATLVGLALAGLAYVAAFAPAVLDNREQLAFPQSDLGLYGAHWTSYLVPPVGHPLLAPWVREFWWQRSFDGMLEQQITIGLGLILLASVALVVYYLEGERTNELAAAPALVGIAAAAFLFSLAPASPEGLLRPSEVLYGFLPMFRAYARFGLVVFLATAILASVGARWLVHSRSQPRRIFGIGLLLLVFLELLPFPPFRWRDVLPTSAHRFLNDRDKPVRVLDCAPPVRIADQPVFLRFAHQISRRRGIVDCGDPDFPTKLAHEGFTHLLVRRQSPLGHWLAERPAPSGATPTGHFDDALLYELERPTQPTLYIEFDRGFHWREFLGDATYRWMKSGGALTIVNPSVEPVDLQLDLKLHAFPDARTIRVEIDGAELAEVRVATEPQVYPLPEVSVSPGRHTLTLNSDSPAVVADSVLGNGDLRELSVALWAWVAN
jgi:hypothetical protein